MAKIPGRPTHDYWKKGHFQMIEKENGRKFALCLVCSRELKNASRHRLVIHRKNCPTVYDTIKKDGNDEHVPKSSMVKVPQSIETNQPAEVIVEKQHDEELSLIEPTTGYQLVEVIAPKEERASPVVKLENESDHDENYDSDATQTSLKLMPVKRLKTLQTALVFPQTNLDAMHTSFTEFFIASAVPFKTLNSPYLKRFIRNLNKSYKPPTLKELTTTYLDKVQERYTQNGDSSREQDATLLLSGWKNFAETSKCVVACLFKKAPNESKESRIFLNTYDLDSDYIVDDDEIQQRIFENSCEIAREQHNAKVYAVVADHLELKVGSNEDGALQQSVCHSFLSSRLADDIIDHNFAKLVNQIHQELLREGIEQQILDRGGTRLVLSTTGRWCTYRDSFRCFTKCNQIVRDLFNESKLSISSIVHDYIFNDDLLEKIQEYADVLEPICELIYVAQKKNSTHAEVAEKWLQLTVPSEYHEQLEQRRNQALTPIALTANFLHPVYRGRKLDAVQMHVVDYFLLKSLDSAGLDQLLLYKRNESVFRILADKRVTSYDTFWTMAERKCPELAAFAKRLLCIPASVSYIDKIFSRWLAVNSDLRNFLGLEMFRKLTRVHFQLNLAES